MSVWLRWWWSETHSPIPHSGHMNECVCPIALLIDRDFLFLFFSFLLLNLIETQRDTWISDHCLSSKPTQIDGCAQHME